VNYTLQGFADSISLFNVIFLQTKFKKITQTLYFLIFLLTFLTMSQIIMNEFMSLDWQAKVVPVMILVIKVQVVSIQNYGYHIN
jgi:hypothetical protein